MKFYCSIFIVILFSCSAQNADNNNISSTWPPKSKLIENFRLADSALIIYAIGDVQLASTIKTALKGLQQFDDRFHVSAKPDTEVTDEDLKNLPIYIIGTQKNSLLKRFDANIPVDFSEQGFIFDGKKYDASTDIIKLSFIPNVFNPQLPVSIIAANNEVELIKYLNENFNESWGYFFWDNWGYQVYHDNKRIMMGNFSDEKETLWSLNKKVHWDFDYRGKKIKENKYIEFYEHTTAINDVSINSLMEKTERDIAAIENFTGNTVGKKIGFHIYPTAEIKALMLNDAEYATIDFENNTLHTVIEEEYKNKYSEAPAMLAFRNLLGQPTISALEQGLAIKFTTGWQQTDINYQTFKLFEAELLPKIKDLLNNKVVLGETDYQMQIAAACFVGFLIEHFGNNKFIENYTGWTSTSTDLLSLDKLWGDYIKMKAETATARQIPINMPDHFLKGFNFAHEGYQIYNGYMGTTAKQSLEKLKSLGVNSVTLIPYSGFRSMNKPAPFNFMSGAGGENDASIIRSAYVAQQMGMSIMLKPQVWSWLGWTGDITMESEADWNLFFDFYERWIVHYALLAELYDIEMFCIGVEFQNASLSEHNKWDRLFDRVRKIYSGKITYAANWGKEFETVSFWDKLDFISVNCYYPLSAKKDPTDDELLTAFEKNLDIIEGVQMKYNKPVIFTEIGFKSIDDPWTRPHFDDDEQNYNEVSQQRCYQVMQKAMSDEAWIQGIYFWKWPSYMEYSDEYNKDFTPCGKAAEATIKEWFTKD